MSRAGAAEPQKGRDFFIVDNSVSGWTGLRYLEEWSSIAKKFDIATGYFEIGALLALDDKWQALEKIRILMGSEVSKRTRKALLEAVSSQAKEKLDGSLEADKEKNPFLRGVPSILEALRSRQIECRVYDREKFHAKAYITHAKLEVIGSQALVGSSNFTRPGLTTNIELNVQIQSAREVAQLQEWYEKLWDNASEVIGISRLGSGKYNLVRFEVLESVVTVDGQNYTATVSSGKLTIAVTKGGVNIEVGQTSHLVIDITPKVMGSATGGFRVVSAVKATAS